MRSKRRLPPFPSWPEQQALWRHSERVLRWLERERLVALWMHGASTRAWVVRALDDGEPRRRRLDLVRDHRLRCLGAGGADAAARRRRG